MICQHGVYLEDKIQGRIADGFRYVSRNFKWEIALTFPVYIEPCFGVRKMVEILYIMCSLSVEVIMVNLWTLLLVVPCKAMVATLHENAQTHFLSPGKTLEEVPPNSVRYQGQKY